MSKNKKFGIIKKEWIMNLINAPKEEQELLMQRFREALHKQKARILKEAFERKLFTQQEYD